MYSKRIFLFIKINNYCLIKLIGKLKLLLFVNKKEKIKNVTNKNYIIA